MSEGNGGSGVNALAIVAILVIVLLAGYFVFQSGVLGGKSDGDNPVKVEVKLPAAPAANP